MSPSGNPSISESELLIWAIFLSLFLSSCAAAARVLQELSPKHGKRIARCVTCTGTLSNGLLLLNGAEIFALVNSVSLTVVYIDVCMCVKYVDSFLVNCYI